MNVECSKCPAKYGVPDAKVRGRKVRITCKRCGSPIVIDGTQLAPESPGKRQQQTMLGGHDAAPGSGPGTQSAPPQASAPVQSVASRAPVSTADKGASSTATALAAASRATAASASGQERSAPGVEPWTVAVTEADQREMTTEQVVLAYVSGVIDEETFVWRDGMEDWLTPFEIPEIAEALRARGLAPPATEARTSQLEAGARRSGAWFEPGRWDADGEDGMGFDEVTVAMAAPRAQELLEAVSSRDAEPLQAARAEAPLPSFDSDDQTAIGRPSFTREEEPPSPTAMAALDSATEFELNQPRQGAARRRDREEQAPDLFGETARRAGSEEEQAEQQEQRQGTLEEGRSGLTGARNESSVLFSLDALSKQTGPSRSAPDQREAEQLLLGGGSRAPSDRGRPDQAPDSIANLGGAPLFGSSMVAPDFTAPPAPSEPPPRVKAPAATTDSLAPEKEGSTGRAGTWVALLVALIVAAGGAFYYLKMMPRAPMAEPPKAGDQAQAASPAPPAAAGDPEEVEETDLDDPSAAEAASASPSVSGVAEPAGATAPGTPPEPTSAPAGPKPGTPDEPPTTTPAPAAQVPDKASPATETAEGPAFDVNAARSALASAAANAASTCATPGGPQGSGKVTVTFANSGRATRTIVTGDLAGTSVGGCIAKVFRSVQVPPFAGEIRRVTKTVTIQ